MVPALDRLDLRRLGMHLRLEARSVLCAVIESQAVISRPSSFGLLNGGDSGIFRTELVHCNALAFAFRHTVVQHPQVAFPAPHLQGCRIERDALNQPRVTGTSSQADNLPIRRFNPLISEPIWIPSPPDQAEVDQSLPCSASSLKAGLDGHDRQLRVRVGRDHFGRFTRHEW